MYNVGISKSKKFAENNFLFFLKEDCFIFIHTLHILKLNVVFVLPGVVAQLSVAARTAGCPTYVNFVFKYRIIIGYRYLILIIIPLLVFYSSLL